MDLPATSTLEPTNRKRRPSSSCCTSEYIFDHHKAGRLDVNPDVQVQLLAEGVKQRGNAKNCVLTKRLRDAAAELRNPDLVIRRADKASIFVLLDKDDYLGNWYMRYFKTL